VPSSGETMSPAENFFKRAFRSHLPTLERFFNPVQKDSEAKVRFQVGDTVRIQNAVSKLWDDSGVIREVRESGRSYYIDRGSGKDIILRNNIYLKLMPERETKRSEFLDEQQKSDSGNDQQQQKLRRSKRIAAAADENNSLRNVQKFSNQQPDTLKLRRSKRIEQAGSLQAGSDSRDTLNLARSNFVERVPAMQNRYSKQISCRKMSPMSAKCALGPDHTTRVQVVHWGQFGNNLAHRSWTEH
jgi:hypothetical protein